MDFSLSEERRMLSDTLSRLLRERCAPDRRNQVAYEFPFHDPNLYADLAALGAVGALVPERDGGFGGSAFDVTVVFEALGCAACPEPLLGALMASRLLSVARVDQSDLVAGTRRYAVAVGERDAPYLPSAMVTVADDGRLTGRKSCVYGGNDADRFLVAARNGALISIYDVAASDAEVLGYGMIDGGGACELILEETAGELLIEDASAAIREATDIGIVAICAEAVGLMETAKDLVLEYIKTREQFGARIGSFQVVQHRVVDMVGEIEQARSITILAASHIGESDQSRVASMAKNLIGRTAKSVAEESIQLHGGIGMTWEAAISHYAKRLVMLDHQLGDTDFHLEQVMAAYAA